MTDKEKLESIQRCVERLESDGYGTGYMANSAMEDVAHIIKIKSTLSPLPHQDGASAEDVIKATIMGYVDPNNVAKISGELMRVFQSETAKVVAEKDKYIRQVQIGMQSVINMQEAEKEAYKRDLSTSNAHRTRLIESVKKWGGAWRTCRAELKEAKRIIEGMEATIRLRYERIMELTQYAYELKTK